MASPTPHSSPESAQLTRRDLLVVVGMLLAWGTFFAVKGTAVSGYHLDDDHEILRLTADLRGGSFLEVLWSWLRNDIRFRPVYYTHRVAAAWAFRDDFRAWGIYTAALGAATFALLYVALRWLRFPPLASLAFAFFSLCGAQAAIWWRIGPNETVGMVCLALACLGLARWSLTGTRGWRALFWAGAVLMSLSKESFVAFLPALFFAAVWSLAAQRGCNWRTALISCVPEAAILGTALVTEALLIVLVFGTEVMGYAGFNGVTPQLVLVAAARLLGWREALTLAGLGVLHALVAGRSRLAGLRALVPGLVLAALAIGSQALVYAKSGVHERYLVPGALGAALLIACLVRAAANAAPPATGGEGSPAKRWLAAHRSLLVAGACLVGLVPLGTRRMRPMMTDAVHYARAGRETQAFLDAVTRFPAGSRIVVAGGTWGVGEGFWSMHTYLSFRAQGLRVSYLLVLPDQAPSPFQEQQLEGFRTNSFFPRFRPEAGEGPPDAVAVLPGEEQRFLRQSAAWFDPGSYARAELDGPLALYARR